MKTTHAATSSCPAATSMRRRLPVALALLPALLLCALPAAFAPRALAQTDIYTSDTDFTLTRATISTTTPRVIQVTGSARAIIRQPAPGTQIGGAFDVTGNNATLTIGATSPDLPAWITFQGFQG